LHPELPGLVGNRFWYYSLQKHSPYSGAGWDITRKDVLRREEELAEECYIDRCQVTVTWHRSRLLFTLLLYFHVLGRRHRIIQDNIIAQDNTGFR
jgi:hypothetical protein